MTIKSSNSNQVIYNENAEILKQTSHITLGNMQYVCGNSLHRSYKLHCLLPCQGSLCRLENKKCLTLYPGAQPLEGGSGGRGAMISSLQFLKQTRSNSFIFIHQRYCFQRVLRNYMDQKFQDIHRVCYNFWAIYGDFSFFLTTQRKISLHLGLSEKVQYLTLDPLKSFSLWTI